MILLNKKGNKMDNNKIRQSLAILKLSCEEAISDDWDRSDDGFRDMIELIEGLESDIPLVPCIGEPQLQIYRVVIDCGLGSSRPKPWFDSYEFILTEQQRYKDIYDLSGQSPKITIESSYVTKVPV